MINLNKRIIVNLDVVIAQRKMRLKTLSELTQISITNLSILKTGKAKAIRFSTLITLCDVLNCQPGDILKYSDSADDPDAAS